MLFFPPMNNRTIRATYNNNNIIVYQAFNNNIASTALRSQTFVSPPFKKERMSWIKPSFLWMMYRSGWATKENQNNILAIDIRREGFEWALQNSCLSHFDKSVHASYKEWKEDLDRFPVRIQWDPEKNIFLQPLPYRSIQIGLSGIAVEKYINDWVVGIRDITEVCKYIHQLINEGKTQQAKDLLPIEDIYLLPNDLARKIKSD